MKYSFLFAAVAAVQPTVYAMPAGSDSNTAAGSALPPVPAPVQAEQVATEVAENLEKVGLSQDVAEQISQEAAKDLGKGDEVKMDDVVKAIGDVGKAAADAANSNATQVAVIISAIKGVTDVTLQNDTASTAAIAAAAAAAAAGESKENVRSIAESAMSSVNEAAGNDSETLQPLSKRQFQAFNPSRACSTDICRACVPFAYDLAFRNYNLQFISSSVSAALYLFPFLSIQLFTTYTWEIGNLDPQSAAEDVEYIVVKTTRNLAGQNQMERGLAKTVSSFIGQAAESSNNIPMAQPAAPQAAQRPKEVPSESGPKDGSISTGTKPSIAPGEKPSGAALQGSPESNTDDAVVAPGDGDARQQSPPAREESDVPEPDEDCGEQAAGPPPNQVGGSEGSVGSVAPVDVQNTAPKEVSQPSKDKGSALEQGPGQPESAPENQQKPRTHDQCSQLYADPKDSKNYIICRLQLPKDSSGHKSTCFDRAFDSRGYCENLNEANQTCGDRASRTYQQCDEGRWGTEEDDFTEELAEIYKALSQCLPDAEKKFNSCLDSQIISETCYFNTVAHVYHPCMMRNTNLGVQKEAQQGCYKKAQDVFIDCWKTEQTSRLFYSCNIEALRVFRQECPKQGAGPTPNQVTESVAQVGSQNTAPPEEALHTVAH
ncbi:hypothetical protein HRG_005332 [Hirsutella rhossiliensis]|uniref:Uncharacterized protein n=1 Tax=Hirsutella rhossiliensis TaxID=111463 RepID=A0A9P8MWU3_9HYPO|nr:uncharacterized protein HRG_05332 [Hirsutella rhossiliensis]KAH0962822.1 hypothetical protein HRG_05332 [Hirsutella rhossiliensis]